MAQSPKKPPNDAVTCPRCGADKWIHGAEVCALAVGLQVRVEQVPGKMTGPYASSPLVAELCGECGLVELQAVHPGDLYRMFASRMQ